MLGVFVSGHKFYVCNLRTKHKICILAYHNLCFCVFVFLGMLHYGDWVATSWLKRVWEKVSFFGFTISVNNLLVCYPREGDDWLMSRFIARGYTANELATLNRVRKHQQVSSSLIS